MGFIMDTRHLYKCSMCEEDIEGVMVSSVDLGDADYVKGGV